MKTPVAKLAYLKTWRKKNRVHVKGMNAKWWKASTGRLRTKKSNAVDDRSWANGKLQRARNAPRSKSQSIEFKITTDDLLKLWYLQKGRCAITKLRLERSTGDSTHPFNASIDRVNHRKGYVKGNIRFVAFCVNSFRGRMSDREMVRVAKAIVKWSK